MYYYLSPTNHHYSKRSFQITCGLYEHPINNMRTILAKHFILERPEEIFQLV